MAKRGAKKPAEAAVLYKAPCRYGTGSWGKETGSLSVKIPVKLCSAAKRADLFVNATLKVRLSTDPETNPTNQLPGMEDNYQDHELAVKVTQHSTNSTDVGFSMSFSRDDMPAAFMKEISHATGSIYVMAVDYPSSED